MYTQKCLEIDDLPPLTPQRVNLENLDQKLPVNKIHLTKTLIFIYLKCNF